MLQIVKLKVALATSQEWKPDLFPVPANIVEVPFFIAVRSGKLVNDAEVRFELNKGETLNKSFTHLVLTGPILAIELCKHQLPSAQIIEPGVGYTFAKHSIEIPLSLLEGMSGGERS
jgi:hypothetical protein